MNNEFTYKDYATVNFDAASNMVDEWNATVNSFGGQYLKATEDNTFKVLEELGISGGFPGKFDNAMENLISSTNSLINEANQYFETAANQDDVLQQEFPNSPRYRNGNGGGGGGNENQQENPSTEPQKAEEPLKDNYEDQIQFLENMSMSDLQEVLAELNTIATDNKVPIDELLDNETLGALLKEKILENPKISEQYRLMLSSGSTVSFVNSLKSLINGKVTEAFGLDDDTLLVMKNYLYNIASENNLSYDSLLTQDQNYSVLKSALSNLKDLPSILGNLNANNVQNRLLEIYDGSNTDNINDDCVYAVRTEVDALTSLSGVNYEELLTVPDYGNELLSCTERLQRTGMYSNLLSNCKNSASILSSLIK